MQSSCSRAAGSIGDTSDGLRFWRAAALACVALQTKDDDTWDRAMAAWQGGGRHYSLDTCQTARVRSTLESILAQAPADGGRPDVELVPSTGGYACPPTELDLSPRSGPPGTIVELTWSGGPWMEYSGELLFGDRAAAGSELGEFRALVTAPDLEPGSYDVTLAFVDGQRVRFGSFTYPRSP